MGLTMDYNMCAGIPVRIFFYYHVQTESGAHPALCWMHTGKLFPGTKLLKHKLTIPCHRLSRLRKCGTLPPCCCMTSCCSIQAKKKHCFYLIKVIQKNCKTDGKYRIWHISCQPVQLLIIPVSYTNLSYKGPVAVVSLAVVAPLPDS